MLLWIVVIAGAVLLDQASKLLVVLFLDRQTPLTLIEGVFRFSYVENRGAAFGMLDEHRWVFLILSTVGILAFLFYLWKFRPKSVLGCLALCFVIGGGIGNMIERILLGYVIDFIDFCAFPSLWPWVFNVADSFVCVGAGMMILWLILETVKEARAKKATEAPAKAEEQSAADGEHTDVE